MNFSRIKRKDLINQNNFIFLSISCEDDNAVMAGSNGQVDPCLKLTVGSDIMVSDYKDIEYQLVKGLAGKFVGLLLKSGSELKEEIWSRYKIKVFDAYDFHHVICERTRKDNTEPIRYFCLTTKKFSINIKSPLDG